MSTLVHRRQDARRRLRRLGAVVGVTALSSSVLLGTAHATPVATDPPAPVLAWADCGDGFQCATATVPLDHDRPRGPSIDLALIKDPADDPASRIGSLFTNPGGPGGSGVEFLRGNTELFDPEVRARFDIVGFDPRGVGASTPFECFDSEDERAEFVERLSAPTDRADELATAAAAIEFSVRCVARNPRLARYMSTANVARDLDLLRAAVFDDRLSYVGLSYGTFLGATYANLFPDRVRALVLDGVIDPVGFVGDGPEGRRTPTFLRVGADVGSAETLEAFFDLCADAGPGSCALAASGDPRAAFAALAERLDGTPVEVPNPGDPAATVVFDRPTLIAATISSLYSGSSWPELAGLLQSLSEAAGLSPAGAPVGADDGAVPDDGAAPDDAVEYDNSLDAGTAVLCVDSANPRNPFAWPALARAADRGTPYVGSYWAYNSQPCATWPARDTDRYTGPWDTPTAGSALVIGTRFDPATPYRNSPALVELMPDAGLLTYEGYGHTAIGQGSTCVTAAVGAYLVSGDLPGSDDATCRPDRLPFDPQPAAAGA